MRSEVTPEKVRQLMRALGRAARGPGCVYFTGGASALLIGWRTATVDVDLRLDPEPPGIFEALRRLKDELDVNVELASPQDFVPELPGWRERSPLIAIEGPVEFRHYDFYAQALSKIERGHGRDLEDVLAMGRRGLVLGQRLEALFQDVVPELVRYPALDEGAFADKVRRAVDRLQAEMRGNDAPA
jgi:Nucleotidyltransferase of unknown function (DUF6036)